MKDFSSLKIKSPYNIKYIEDVKFDWKPNEHASFYLKGIVEDSAQFNAVNSAGDGDEFTLYEGEEDKTIFKGQTSSVKVTNVNGIYYIELKGISGSFNLDQSKKSRSFQDENMEYGSLISQTIKDYSGSKFIQNIGEGEKLGKPIIQYKETDWEFLKRMVSKFNSVIICDIMENKPRFNFGLPELRTYTIEDNIPYTVVKNIKAFEKSGAAEAGLRNIDFFAYEIESSEQYSIGDRINFKNKNLAVTEVHGFMDRGIFKYKYKLSMPEGLYQSEIKNKALSGAAIDGKILAVQGETVRMHLSIDNEQVTTKAHWFSFAPPTGNMMYCMPKVGTSARLYFPDTDSGNAEVTGNVRDNGGSCAKTGNPNNRYLGTEHGSELAMLPNEMSIKGGSASPLSIKFDGSGVILTSPKNLILSAAEDVFLKTPKKIIINATNRFLATKGKAVKGISIEGDVNCLGGAAKIEAKDRTSYPNFNDEPKADKKAKEKAEEQKKKSWLMTGLCVLAAVAVVAVAVTVSVATFGAGAVIGAALIGAAIGAATSFVTTKGSLEDRLKAAAKGALVGLICGAMFGPASGIVTDMLTGGASSVLTDMVDKLAKGETINPLDELGKFAEGALLGVAFGGLIRGGMKAGGKVLEAAAPFIKNTAKDVEDRFLPAAEKGAEDLEGKAGSEVEQNTEKLLSKEPEPEVNADISVEKPNEESAIDRAPESDGGATKAPEGDNVNNHGQQSTADEKGGNQSEEVEDKAVDPINVGTGSFRMDFVDLVMEDRGLPIKIKREYTSQDTSIGSMGRGWSFNFETKLEYGKNESELNLICEDGHVEKFIKHNENWKAENGSKAFKLIENYEGFILKAKNKKIYTYDEAGKLKEISDRNKNKIKLEYDEAGHIKTLTSPSGKVISFKYNYDKLVEIEDNVGRKVKYTYDKDNLTAVELPNEGIVTYEYKDNLITSVTDQAGKNYVKNKYDNLKRVIKQKNKEGNITDIKYDDKNMETVVISHSRGTTIRYKHNYKNLVTDTIYGDGTSESCTYDKLDNKITETDRNGNTIKNIFDESGNLLEKIYPDGYSIKNEYNEAGDLTRSYSSGGREILYGYDDRGNMLYKSVKISQGYSKTTYTYDSYGRMLTKTDPEGNTTTFSYFESEIDKPTTVTDPEKNEFEYSYNKAGIVTSIKTKYGTVKFGYNALNRKTHITDAKGNTTRFMYDKMGNLVKKVLPREYKCDVDNGTGYEYRYDALDRRIETIDPRLNVYKVKYDEEGNILKEINPNYLDRGIGDGIGVEYEYDDANRRIKIKYPTGGIKRIKYDSKGNIIKIIEPANYEAEADDGCGREYEYDNRNRLTVVKNQGKVEKKFIYDIDGRVVKEINAKGYLSAESDELRFGTLYEYNAADWLTEKRVPVSKENGEILYNVTVYKYDLAGRKIEEKRSRQYVKEKEYPEEWNTINYSYDKNSRIIKISDSTGAEINYAYDCLSNRTLEKAKINDSTYKTKRYYYDSIGHLYKIKEEINKEDLAEKTDRLTEAAETLYEYDANGNIIKVVTPEGYESIMTYDAANRLVEIKKAINHGRNYRVTTYEYDKAGNIVKETDSSGNSIKYEYDTMNRQTKIIDKEGGVTRLYYDASGNIIKQITPENYDSSSDDGKGTTYSYDNMNRLVKVTNALGVIVQKNKYNEAGELIEKQDASKTGVNYTYDIGGRIKNIMTPKAIENNAVSQEYFYDALGNVTGIKDGEGNQTSYNLDPWGRITEINKADGSREWYSYDYAGNIINTIDGNGNKTEYSYNSFNLLSQIKDPAGELMTYQYDRQGRLSKQVDRNKNIIEYVYNEDDNVVTKREENSGITESRKYNIDGSLAAAIANGRAYNYNYTPNGRLKSKSINGKTIIGYDYDKNGNVTSITDIIGRNVAYKYDVLGRMSEVLAGENKTAFYSYNEDSTVAAIKYANGINIDYFHDADKNISGILARNAAGEELLNHNYSYDNNGNQTKRTEEGKSTSYIYDSLNRLSKVSYPDYTEVFSYDKAGNRVERNAKGLISQYSYDVRNRLTQIEEAGNFTSFEYDNQGNILVEKSKQGVKAYTYDCFNRTASVTNSDGTYIKNYYDPEGLRSEINENGDISRFIFDRGNVITELDSENNLKAATIRGLGIVAQIDAERNSYYYLNNYHGDVTAITDASGSIVNSYKYDAFGNTVEANEKVHNRFRYCGEQFDNVSNQYYLRARFYNPVIGRFTQEDVYRGDGLNLYAYVGNNPVNYSDPSGYECDKGSPFENNQKPPNEQPKQLMLPPGNEITDPSRMLPAPRDLITDPGKMLPAPGQSSFNKGERIMTVDAYNKFIKDMVDNGKPFKLGRPDYNSFFFNKPGENLGKDSWSAVVNAGYSEGDLADLVNNSGGKIQMVRITFKLDNVQDVVVPGVSKVPGGIGDGEIPGVNEMYTGNGRTQNVYGELTMNEYIGTNIDLSGDDIISVKKLEVVPTK